MVVEEILILIVVLVILYALYRVYWEITHPVNAIEDNAKSLGGTIGL